MANYERDYLFAQMANQSYKDNPSPINNWVVVDKMIDPSTGFAACAYKNPQTNEVVIAYRGTDGIKKDASADAALARDSKAMLVTPYTAAAAFVTSNWDAQFTQALDFAARVNHNNPQSQISVTGHSLGGGLAQISAKMYGFAGVTFDPAGAQNVVDSKQFREYAHSHGLSEKGRGGNNEPHNYEVKSSPISGLTGAHVGRSTDLTGYYADGRSVGHYDVSSRHSMERIEGIFAVAAIKGKLPEVAMVQPLQQDNGAQIAQSVELSKTAQTLITDATTHTKQWVSDNNREWNEQFNQAAHSVAHAAHKEGLTGINLFLVKDGEIHFAQRNHLGTNVASVDAKIASNTDVSTNLQAMADIDQTRTHSRLQAQEQALTQGRGRSI